MDDALRRALYAELAVVQAGLLEVIGAGSHPRPMYHLSAGASAGKGAELWFLTPADSDLVAEVGQGATARFCLTGHRHDLFASLTGPIRTAPDRQGLERVWSPAAEAQFPGGLQDLEWTPLHMQPAEAAVWTTARSAVLEGMDLILSGLAERQDRTDDHALLKL